MGAVSVLVEEGRNLCVELMELGRVMEILAVMTWLLQERRLLPSCRMNVRDNFTCLGKRNSRQTETRRRVRAEREARWYHAQLVNLLVNHQVTDFPLWKRIFKGKMFSRWIFDWKREWWWSIQDYKITEELKSPFVLLLLLLMHFRTSHSIYCILYLWAVIIRRCCVVFSLWFTTRGGGYFTRSGSIS